MYGWETHVDKSVRKRKRGKRAEIERGKKREEMKTEGREMERRNVEK